MMHDNLRELIKSAELSVPESTQKRIDECLADLPKKKTSAFPRYIAAAVAACVVLFILFFAVTPEGRAKAAQLIEWFRDHVFVTGVSSPQKDNLSAYEGFEKTYASADDLLREWDIELLAYEGAEKYELTVRKGIIRIISVCGNVRVYQHALYDGKNYEHGVFTDYGDNDEPYSITIGGIELVGFISDNGCYIIGSKDGMWYEINSDTATKQEFREFTKGLVLRGGEGK